MTSTAMTSTAATSKRREGQGRAKRPTPRIRIPFGVHARFTDQAVVYDSRSAVNGHMLVAGPSGTGKSHQLNRIALTLAEQGSRVYIIDVHGDLGDLSDLAPFREQPIPDIVHTITFGEQTRYGLPPLDLMDDPEGGPRKRANAFVSLLERQGALGPKQRTALFRLLMDLYRRHGFYPDDPRTWSVSHDPRANRSAAPAKIPRPGMKALPSMDWYNKSDIEKATIKEEYSVSFNPLTKCFEISEQHPKAAEAVARWGAQPGKRQPSLADLKRLLWERLVMMRTGQTAPAVRAFEKVMALAGKRARLRGRRIAASEAEELDKIESQIGKAQQEAIEAFTEGMEKVDSGQEFEELILWDSADAVKGLFDRVEALEASGIFKGEPPPFDDDVPIWRYNIKSLSDDEQQLFVDVLLERIYLEAKSRGEAEGPDMFVLLDESHKFVVDDGDHIINRMVKEARKFGLGLVLASQAFVHFSDDLLMSAGVKLVLGCPEMYREPMRRKLGLEMLEFKGRKINPLALIRPKHTAMVSISTAGQNSPMADIVIASG